MKGRTTKMEGGENSKPRSREKSLRRSPRRRSSPKRRKKKGRVINNKVMNEEASPRREEKKKRVPIRLSRLGIGAEVSLRDAGKGKEYHFVRKPKEGEGRLGKKKRLRRKRGKRQFQCIVEKRWKTSRGGKESRTLLSAKKAARIRNRELREQGKGFVLSFLEEREGRSFFDEIPSCLNPIRRGKKKGYVM